MNEAIKLAEQYANNLFGANPEPGTKANRYHIHAKRDFIEGFKAGEGKTIWKIIEGFQDMMLAEGLDREADINDDHLSYNDVETYLYSLLPEPPKS